MTRLSAKKRRWTSKFQRYARRILRNLVGVDELLLEVLAEDLELVNRIQNLTEDYEDFQSRLVVAAWLSGKMDLLATRTEQMRIHAGAVVGLC